MINYALFFVLGFLLGGYVTVRQMREEREKNLVAVKEKINKQGKRLLAEVYLKDNDLNIEIKERIE
ncbi:hypothetical protein SDC9_177751 [bioreactor metagenome]|uniref:Uncharacterized protein n=1 Tax=bioreactor metagenome TaxID=1076179 RepID=A0A645GTX7_9ZZZZ|nr:hypothetical protein [Synergistaceae bacterium]